jgi:hypothetical protein
VKRVTKSGFIDPGAFDSMYDSSVFTLVKLASSDVGVNAVGEIAVLFEALFASPQKMLVRGAATRGALAAVAAAIGSPKAAIKLEITPSNKSAETLDDPIRRPGVSVSVPARR